MAMRIWPRDQPGPGYKARVRPGGISAAVRFVRAAEAARARRHGAAVSGAVGRRRGWRSCASIKQVLAATWWRPKTCGGSATRRWSPLRLSHGNLVTVFDAGLRGRPDLPGDGLRRRARTCWRPGTAAPSSASPSRSTSRSTSSRSSRRGLGYAHAFEDLKLVHRDVSPANVLLSYTGEVKLTDFGLAMSTLKMRADGARDHLRQAELPGARAGAPRAARRPHRPLRRRDPAVGAADRPPAVPGRHARRSGRATADHSDALAAGARSAGVAAVDASPTACRPSWTHRDARAGARARGSLPDRRGAARRPGARSCRDRAQDRRRLAWPSSCARCSRRTPTASGASAKR